MISCGILGMTVSVGVGLFAFEDFEPIRGAVMDGMGKPGRLCLRVGQRVTCTMPERPRALAWLRLNIMSA